MNRRMTQTLARKIPCGLLALAPTCTMTPFCGYGNDADSFTPVEKADIDRYIKEHGTRVILAYLCAQNSTHNQQRTLKYLKHFESQGADVNNPYILYAAIKIRCDVETVKFLISKGADADVNAKGDRGNTPLYLAVEQGNLEIAELLVSKGADVNAKGYGDKTPLYLAVEQGNLEIAEFLVSKGADMNTKDIGGGTPLHNAATQGNLEIVKFLVSKGADVNIRNNYGNTPLHIAALWGRLEIVKFLVSKGADLKAKNKKGETPLDSARSHKTVDYTKVTKYLKP